MMQLAVLRSMWGIEAPPSVVLPSLRARGYDGVAANLDELADAAAFAALAREHDLGLVLLVVTEGPDLAAHLESLRAKAQVAAAVEPLLVNCHGGRDAFGEADAARFFEAALRLEEDLGRELAHETHRGRILYNPWVAGRMLARFPELHLCCDFSHWVTVCERVPEEPAIFEACAGACVHLHARVGHAEGPQVGDPRDPRHADVVAAHEGWWRAIWRAQAAAGRVLSTVEPEYGPPPYLPTLPHSGEPVADQEELCRWQAGRLRELFAAELGA